MTKNDNIIDKDHFLKWARETYAVYASASLPNGKRPGMFELSEFRVYLENNGYAICKGSSRLYDGASLITAQSHFNSIIGSPINHKPLMEEWALKLPIKYKSSYIPEDNKKSGKMNLITFSVFPEGNGYKVEFKGKSIYQGNSFNSAAYEYNTIINRSILAENNNRSESENQIKF
jgi:hypothetical protein